MWEEKGGVGREKGEKEERMWGERGRVGREKGEKEERIWGGEKGGEMNT